MKRKILILGGSYMNLQMKIDPRTKENDLTLGAEYRFHPYGEAAVTAITVSKLGGECVFGTKLGDDTNGKRLYEYYKQCGIKKDLMKKDASAQTGMSVTLYSDFDTHSTYLSRGVSSSFTKREIDDAFVSVPDMFLVPPEELGFEEHEVEMTLGKSEEKPSEADGSADETKVEASVAEENGEKDAETVGKKDVETVGEKDVEKESTDEMSEVQKTSTYIRRESLALYAVQEAQRRNIDLIMQYTPFTAKFPLEKINGIKVLVISDKALYALTGFYPNSTEKALRSLVALSQKIKAKYYVIQQGESSAFVYDGRFYEIVSAPVSLRKVTKSQEKEMNSTFMGALAAEYLESRNIIRACHFAIVVSLLSRSKFGNLEKVPTKAELEAYAAEHGINLYRG